MDPLKVGGPLNSIHGPNEIGESQRAWSSESLLEEIFTNLIQLSQIVERGKASIACEPLYILESICYYSLAYTPYMPINYEIVATGFIFSFNINY